jgi:F-type H+-transporting ATPase subunit epsilon
VKLAVYTPLSVVVEAPAVAHVRAEDATGAFGILPGHADFLTVLALSVLSWRDSTGQEHHVALRGGVLEVRAGTSVFVATREAVVGDDLKRLELEVVSRFNSELSAEKSARVDAQRLYLAAVRQIVRYLRPDVADAHADR